jgi:hypothetical protein
MKTGRSPRGEPAARLGPDRRRLFLQAMRRKDIRRVCVRLCVVWVSERPG